MITASCRLLFPINRKQLNPLNFSCTREFASAQDFTTSKLKHEKDSLPPKPKRPLNACLQYYNSIKIKLAEEYPHYKRAELIKKASEQWAQIDPTIKQNLQKQYHEQNSIYKQKLTEYENSLTDGQKIEAIQELLEKGHTLNKGKVNKKLKELGKPKRPLSAFMLFLQNKRVTKSPEVRQKDWLISMSEEWKNMTKETKNQYHAEAKDLLEKYNIEIKKWEEDQQHRSTEGLVLHDNKNTLQTAIEHQRNTAMDASINDVKRTVVQPYDTHKHTQIYTYFVSTWKRVLTVLKEISENWKMKLY